VKDESGSTVSGASVYINCYPSSGGSYSDTDTSGTAGVYAGGWLDKNCNGETMVVKAVKGSKSGTVTWDANGVVDVKNIMISTPTFSTGELHCEVEPMTMSQAGVATTCPVHLYVQMACPVKLVNGGTATLHYETNTMSCSGVSSSPGSPFVVTYSDIDPTSGTITVEAHTPGGVFVPVQNGEHVTSFFDVFFEAIDVNTPKISNVTVTSNIYTEGGMEISTFPSRTEYLIGTAHTCSGYLLIDSEEEWLKSISSGHVRPLLEDEWTGYMEQWSAYKEEGDPYPTNTFKPASLDVYGGGGGGGGGCEDAGLVMMWGDPTLPSGSYSSAWEYDYLLDPDLSNSTITVTVTPKQFDPNGNQVNAVSFGIKDINGNIRSWWWSCPVPLAWNVPTTITIDASKVGVAATNPVATGFANNPAFNIKNSQFFVVDENFNWIFGQMPVPPPGLMQLGVMWNYWHNLIVTPRVSSPKHAKYYTKWSQPPVEIDTTHPTVFLGWNEPANYNMRPLVADDWLCKDRRPVTDIHWWGSFIGWNQPNPPAVMPTAFHIGIWTDVPAGGQTTFSHPGTLVWQNLCDTSVWNFAGYDKDPRPDGQENEACFQFNQLLSQDEWFYQKSDEADGTVYWLSIAAIYPAGTQVDYPFGMKTRERFYNDDAVRIGMVNDPTGTDIWPPFIGCQWANGSPIEFPVGTSWDMAFELSTNEPGQEYNIADFNKDGIVNFFDFAIFAQEWLKTGP
ncbi:MAG: hypothetical protein IMZ61_08140, partial [Planctomycetes bacterium]|nr:hypothetical protein [Planctomycetota bacterium]